MANFVEKVTRTPGRTFLRKRGRIGRRTVATRERHPRRECYVGRKEPCGVCCVVAATNSKTRPFARLSFDNEIIDAEARVALEKCHERMLCDPLEREERKSLDDSTDPTRGNASVLRGQL